MTNNPTDTTDTPRTDEQIWTTDFDSKYCDVVDMEFARQLERELAESKAEVERLERPKRIKVVAHSLKGNGFGAYLAGSLQDGEAFILLDLFACLAVDLDPSKTLAETMAHEVLHVCQEALGQQISESDINSAMAKIQGYELAEAEDLEQIIQDLTRHQLETSSRAEKAEAEVERLHVFIKKCLELLDHDLPTSDTRRLFEEYESQYGKLQ